MIKYLTKLVPVVTLAIVLQVGCGGRPTMKTMDGREAVVMESRYELLWVEPQIIVADSLMTLIRSDRVDSVLIEPSALLTRPKTSVELRILEPVCETKVGLYNSDLQLVYPLMLRRLHYGHYRLTVNLDRFNKPSLPVGSYFLRSDYCGRTEMTMVTID